VRPRRDKRVVWVQTNVGRPPNNSASLPGRVHWRSVRYVFRRFFSRGRRGHLPFTPPRAWAALCRPRSGGGRRRPRWRAPSSSPLTRLWPDFRLMILVYCSNRRWRWCGPMAALLSPAVSPNFGTVRRLSVDLVRRRRLLRRRRSGSRLRRRAPLALPMLLLLLVPSRRPLTPRLLRAARALLCPPVRGDPPPQARRAAPLGRNRPPQAPRLPVQRGRPHRCPPLPRGPIFCAAPPLRLPLLGRPLSPHGRARLCPPRRPPRSMPATGRAPRGHWLFVVARAEARARPRTLIRRRPARQRFLVRPLVANPPPRRRLHRWTRPLFRLQALPPRSPR